MRCILKNVIRNSKGQQFHNNVSYSITYPIIYNCDYDLFWDNSPIIAAWFELCYNIFRFTPRWWVVWALIQNWIYIHCVDKETFALHCILGFIFYREDLFFVEQQFRISDFPPCFPEHPFSLTRHQGSLLWTTSFRLLLYHSFKSLKMKTSHHFILNKIDSKSGKF